MLFCQLSNDGVWILANCTTWILPCSKISVSLTKKGRWLILQQTFPETISSFIIHIFLQRNHLHCILYWYDYLRIPQTVSQLFSTPLPNLLLSISPSQPSSTTTMFYLYRPPPSVVGVSRTEFVFACWYPMNYVLIATGRPNVFYIQYSYEVR